MYSTVLGISFGTTARFDSNQLDFNRFDFFLAGFDIDLKRQIKINSMLKIDSFKFRNVFTSPVNGFLMQQTNESSFPVILKFGTLYLLLSFWIVSGTITNSTGFFNDFIAEFSCKITIVFKLTISIWLRLTHGILDDKFTALFQIFDEQTAFHVDFEKVLYVDKHAVIRFKQHFRSAALEREDERDFRLSRGKSTGFTDRERS